MGAISRVEENAADQKAGEDEEEVHPAPADGQGAEQPVDPITQGGMLDASDVVENDYEQYGEAAEAVELRDASAEVGERADRLPRGGRDDRINCCQLHGPLALRSGAKAGIRDEKRRAPDSAIGAARRGKRQENFNAIVKRWLTPNNEDSREGS